MEDGAALCGQLLVQLRPAHTMNEFIMQYNNTLCVGGWSPVMFPSTGCGERSSLLILWPSWTVLVAPGLTPAGSGCSTATLGGCHIPLLRICMAFPILVGIRFLYLLLWIGNTAILLMKRKLHFFPFSPRMDFGPYHSLHTRPISTQDGFICMSAPTQHLLLEPNIYKHLLLEPNIYYLIPTSTT